MQRGRRRVLLYGRGSPLVNPILRIQAGGVQVGLLRRRYCTSTIEIESDTENESESALGKDEIPLRLSRSAFDGDFTSEEIGDNVGGEEEGIIMDHLFTLLEKPPINCPLQFLGKSSSTQNYLYQCLICFSSCKKEWY